MSAAHPLTELDESKIIPVTGGQPISFRKFLSDLPSECRKCRRKLDELRCTKIDCDGCTFRCEHDPCGVALGHFGRNFKLDAGGEKRDGLVFDQAGDAQAIQSDVHRGLGADQQSIGIGVVAAPDKDLSITVAFDSRASVGQHACNYHLSVPSDGPLDPKLAEAGGRETPLTGGGPTHV